jgi:glutathione-specific gamma-glutamylcyclotransferase
LVVVVLRKHANAPRKKKLKEEVYCKFLSVPPKTSPLSASQPDPYAHLRAQGRDPSALLAATQQQWLSRGRGRGDLWVFGYASLIWNPGFGFAEQRAARIYGHHRALKMWSRINRGTPECPGLVFALLSGGSCQGLVFRVPRSEVPHMLQTLWQREMPTAVYEPTWVQCHTSRGPVSALAFVLPRSSPSYTGPLSAKQYQHIFAKATGRYGSTLDYALRTHTALLAHGIGDKALVQLLRQAGALA